MGGKLVTWDKSQILHAVYYSVYQRAFAMLYEHLTGNLHIQKSPVLALLISSFKPRHNNDFLYFNVWKLCDTVNLDCPACGFMYMSKPWRGADHRKIKLTIVSDIVCHDGWKWPVQPQELPCGAHMMNTHSWLIVDNAVT